MGIGETKYYQDKEKTNEALLILMEECNELSQICSKIIRFGEDSYHPDTTAAMENDDKIKTNLDLLQSEMGDVLAMMMVVCSMYKIDPSIQIESAMKKKLDKLKKYSNISSETIDEVQAAWMSE